MLDCWSVCILCSIGLFGIGANVWCSNSHRETSVIAAAAAWMSSNLAAVSVEMLRPRVVHFDLSVSSLPLVLSTSDVVTQREVEYTKGLVGTHRIRTRLPAECVPLADWQTSNHQACSKIHELDLTDLVDDTNGEERASLVASGAFRQVWLVREYNGAKRALKTLIYGDDQDFDHSSMIRHQIDAAVYEELSPSPLIPNIHGYCVNSAVFDFSSGETLRDYIETNPSNQQRLQVAHLVAAALNDVHHVDSHGNATIAHNDLKPNQIVRIDGKWQLNDFNKAKLLGWNKETNKPCGYEVKKNNGGKVSTGRADWLPGIDLR